MMTRYRELIAVVLLVVTGVICVVYKGRQTAKSIREGPSERNVFIKECELKIPSGASVVLTCEENLQIATWLYPRPVMICSWEQAMAKAATMPEAWIVRCPQGPHGPDWKRASVTQLNDLR